jgi:AAA+ superfamily predicted ATPase
MHRDATTTALGPLELETYRRLWREARAFAPREPVREDDDAGPRQGLVRRDARSVRRSFVAVRHLTDVDDPERDDDPPSGARPSEGYPPDPRRTIASLLFARIIDRTPGLRDQLRGGAPVVLIEVSDRAALGALEGAWRAVAFGPGRRLMDLADDPVRPRARLDGLYAFRKEPKKGSAGAAFERAAVAMLGFALPVVCISSSMAHLPDALNRASTHRLVFPPIDAAAVARAVRVATGKRCAVGSVDADLAARATMDDLALAIRFDRTPETCLTELRRLTAPRGATVSPSGIRLADLHGQDDARAFAENALAELAAWHRNELDWDSAAASTSALFVGPPGTGKTLMAEALSREISARFGASGIETLVACSFARWQSAGENQHLGSLLAAMRNDYLSASAQVERTGIPLVLLIDEVDSLPARTLATKSSSGPYFRAALNGLLELSDSRKNPGILQIATTNSVETCDPALLRAGRFGRVIRFGLPDVAAIARILRVLLGSDLDGHDLKEIAEMAAGMAAADIGRVVDDARRLARHGGRALALSDLRAALGVADLPEPLRWRAAVHEAGHAVVDVLRFGPDGVVANLAATAERLGAAVRERCATFAGTPDEYEARLEVMLAGRTAEDLILGQPSHFAAGDLEAATRLAATMLGALGMPGPCPLTSLGPPASAHDFLRHREVREAVGLLLADAEATCRGLLEANLGALVAVARRLTDRGRIVGLEVANFIERCGGLAPSDPKALRPGPTRIKAPRPS